MYLEGIGIASIFHWKMTGAQLAFYILPVSGPVSLLEVDVGSPHRSPALLAWDIFGRVDPSYGVYIYISYAYIMVRIGPY